ncbi:MAG: hypothetical protein IT336_16330 [Thermomicrobiales bacterium]|nr:hypothetical protein [Thermomicrobiales bacterium]
MRRVTALPPAVRRWPAILAAFALILTTLTACIEAEAKACPPLEPWLTATRDRVERGDAMLADVQERDLYLDFETLGTLLIYAEAFRGLAGEQDGSQPPPVASEINALLVDAFLGYAYVLDEANVTAFAAGVGTLVFMGGLGGFADLMLSFIYDSLEFQFQQYGRPSELLDLLLTDEICAGNGQGAPVIPPGVTPSAAIDASADLAIDWTFVSDRVGGQRLDGYVPDAPNSQSGVTIATGVDLGQWSSMELAEFGLPGDLIAKLTPYLGLRQGAALAAIDRTPLLLDRTEADQLDRVVHGVIVADVTRDYDDAVAAANRSPRFAALPPEAQTVIASVAMQYGQHLSVATPRFWAAVTDGRWADAVAELRAFGDDYPTRRNLEADLLQTALDRGAL